MIRMVYPKIEHEIVWNSETRINELVLESPIFFREFTNSLNFPVDDGSGVNFLEDGKTLKSDFVEVIFNPEKLDFNSRKPATTLFKILAKVSVSEEFYLSTNRFKTEIVEYINKIIDSENFGFEVTSEADFTLDQVAKAVNFHISSDDDDYIEFLTDYLEVMTELDG